ncbi:MAG: TM2 domain-containing protein [Dehalococcoidia bacterium]|nr:TM2 domain-containing protein [Dehalococcoidia bacterium]
MEQTSNFCSKCGMRAAFTQDSPEQQYQNAQEQPAYTPPAAQREYTRASEQKSRLVAGLLQIFLGWLGIGRFYLGYTGIAIAQLLVTIFTLGIGVIWPLIDGILILTGSVAVDGKGIPLKE